MSDRYGRRARHSKATFSSPKASVPMDDDAHIEIEQLDGADAQAYEDMVRHDMEQSVSGKRKREDFKTPSAVRNSETFRFYNALVEELKGRSDCADFSEPVMEMWSEEDVPGYLDRVKQPMDLRTLTERLHNDHYVEAWGSQSYYFKQNACSDDIRLIFKNCMNYNDPESNLHYIAEKLLKFVNKKLSDHEARVNMEFNQKLKKSRKDMERRRRNATELRVADLEAKNLRQKQEVEQMKRLVQETEMKNKKLKESEQQWMQRVKLEREKVKNSAVLELKSKMEEEHRAMKNVRGNRGAGSDIMSGDEFEQHNYEVQFVFADTSGMEKKRGRKSALVMELESKHDELMRRRRTMLELGIELDKMKQVEMTYKEKEAVCHRVRKLDFVRMKTVAGILAKGLIRPDILNMLEIEMDCSSINNATMREIEFFLKSPSAMTAFDALRAVETEISNIESQLVQIRYQPIGSTSS